MDTKICSRCGTERDVKKFKTDTRYPDGRTKTCRICYRIGHGIHRTPEQIESQRQKLLGRKYSLDHRLAISRGQKKAVEEGRHHWKVNQDRHKDQDRTSIAYRMWKEKLREKNNGKCEECGSEKRLHAHHIKCFYEYPELRFELFNGKLLCNSCHTRFHAKERKTRSIRTL